MEGNEKEFVFKKFKVKHGFKSLPITTEALVFGGILAKNSKKSKIALEIGTGCGILSLMITQKNRTQIHSVEIDENAFELAFENVQNSIFAYQIGVFHTDIQHFVSDLGKRKTEKYDLIFTNPPFFQNHLKGKNKQQNLAKHNDTLSFQILAEQVERFLEKNGKFMVLLPPHELGLLAIELNKFNLTKNAEICISHSENSKVLRIIATFAYKEGDFRQTSFVIKDQNNEYTDQFKELLKDYYLIF